MANWFAMRHIYVEKLEVTGRRLRSVLIGLK
jgi:hypothetical protein